MTAPLLGPATGLHGKLLCSSSRCTGDGHVCRAGELSATQPHPPAHGGKVSFKRTRKPALWPLTKVTTASKDQGPVQVKLKVMCVSGGCFSLWLALAKFLPSSERRPTDAVLGWLPLRPRDGGSTTRSRVGGRGEWTVSRRSAFALKIKEAKVQDGCDHRVTKAVP